MKRLLRHLPLCGLLALSAVACEKGPADPNPDGPDISWLRRNVVELKTTEPGRGFSDLAAFGEMVGDARIVGLGEQTHGTREFFQMKHRALEYLVKEHGFNTFAIEAPWAEARRMNDYVLNGVGDPEVLLSGLLYWTWNTEEVLAMIRWMREHNQNPGGAPRVSFHGFDVQHARVAMNDVVAYLRQVSDASADSAVAQYACYREWEDGRGFYGGAVPATQAACRQGVEAAYAQMAAGATAYAAATGADAYDVALRAARIVVQNEHVRRVPSQGPALRDQYMAETVDWIAGPAASGRKVVVWAHSGHISNREPWMGSHLARTHGDAYRIVGFSFYRGAFSVTVPGGQLTSVGAPPALEESYEYQFHRLGLPRFMVDLRPVRRGQAAGAEWLAGPMPMRHVGSMYDTSAPDLYFLPAWLTQEYDVMIHVEESTATRRLPFRSE
ncbi:erythromycin esterase family protein [Longimicrobium sp.]|uniref:erythromycin esterase family protein n=1 Tax=Longimicrobium sp. TaxID=2029185 RepID=UPI003B3BA837